jgi:predicted Abi (CAAX) family protease
MLRLFVVLASILLIAVSAGCLEQAHTNAPLTASEATTTLKINAQPSVNQSEYATFSCQLNVTRGQGLDNKEIHWSIDNVNKGTTRTVWGYASLNLTIPETKGLSIGKHVLTASFDGDSDYTPSHATMTFQVRVAPTRTPSAWPARSAKTHQ